MNYLSKHKLHAELNSIYFLFVFIRDGKILDVEMGKLDH
jgi:hypothetical protein